MQDLLWNPVIWWPLLVAVLGGLLVAIGWSFFYGLRSAARIEAANGDNALETLLLPVQAA